MQKVGEWGPLVGSSNTLITFLFLTKNSSDFLHMTMLMYVSLFSGVACDICFVLRMCGTNRQIPSNFLISLPILNVSFHPRSLIPFKGDDQI